MTKHYTPESLQEESRRLHEELKLCSASIGRKWIALTTPPAAQGKVQMWVEQAEKAVALYDGAMTGYKLFKALSRWRPKWSRKSRKN